MKLFCANSLVFVQFCTYVIYTITNTRGKYNMKNQNERKLDKSEFKIALIHAGIKQKEFAYLVGITPNFLSDIVNNRRFDYGQALKDQIELFISDPVSVVKKLQKQTA